MRLATPPVIRRFLLIELWFLRILNHLKFINDLVLRTAVQNVFKQFKRLDASTHFDMSEEYMGTNIDISKKEKKEAFKNKFWPYVPEKHMFTHGKLREIGLRSRTKE
jgi:hypothetical protein